MKTVKFVWKLVMFRKWLFLINIIAYSCFTVLGLGTGYVTSKFFDLLSSDSTLGLNVYALLSILLGIALGRIITDLVSLIIWASVQFLYLLLMRKNLLEKVLKYSGSAIRDRSSTGDLTNRMREDAQAIINFLEYWIDGSAAFCYAVVALGVMLSINPYITVVIVVPLVLIIITAKVLNGKIEKYYSISRESTGNFSGFLVELLGAVQSVKVGGAENSVLKHYQKLSNQRHQDALKSATLSSVVKSINGNVLNIATGVILLLAAQSMREGNFTVGNFTLFVAYLSQVSWLVSMFGWYLASQRTVQVSIERMSKWLPNEDPDELIEYCDLLNSPPFHHPELVQKKADEHRLHEVALKDVSFRYPATQNGIRNISFTLEKGSLTVITGKIGSGKTTLLRVLLGLLPKEAGEIMWNGQPIEQVESFMIPPRVAYSPQVPRLFSDTLRSNILLGLPNDPVNLQKAIHTAVLDQDIGGMENGLDTVIGPRGVRLSGGQMQRTAAARSLVTNSELFIFDDISSALDVETEKLLWERIFTNYNATCIVISHRRATFELADQIIVLKDGCVEAIGKLEELLKSSAEMEKLYHGSALEVPA